jgi:hypothetical protein
MCVGLRETHAVGRDFVNGRGVKIRRAETIGVERALVVGKDEDDIGTSGAAAKAIAAECRAAEKGCT